MQKRLLLLSVGLALPVGKSKFVEGIPGKVKETFYESLLASPGNNTFLNFRINTATCLRLVRTPF